MIKSQLGLLDNLENDFLTKAGKLESMEKTHKQPSFHCFHFSCFPYKTIASGYSVVPIYKSQTCTKNQRGKISSASPDFLCGSTA